MAPSRLRPLTILILLASREFSPPATHAGETPTIEFLIDRLTTSSEREWNKASTALYERAGKRDPKDLAALVKAGQHPDERVRAGVMIPLQRWCRSPEPADPDPLPVLLTGLRDKSALVRSNAAYGVGGFAYRSKEVVPALLRLLDDTTRPAPKDLQLVYPERGWSGGRVCLMASRGLSGAGPEARPALMPLIRRLDIGDDEQRGQAVQCLAYLARYNREFVPVVVPVLASLVNDRKAGLEGAAAHGLWLIGPPAKWAVPSLVRALRADDYPDRALKETVQTACLIALEKMGPDAVAALPDLIAIMKDHRRPTDQRCWAANAAGKLGRAGLPAVPHLEGLRKSMWADSHVDQVVRAALKQIRTAKD
jgi:HEAT repeat protein